MDGDGDGDFMTLRGLGSGLLNIGLLLLGFWSLGVFGC